MKQVHRSRQAAVQLKNIDLNLLVVLDDLHTTRSTTTTARRLGRTQSAISHALARLRDVFDDPLFVRSGRALAPTATALALAGPLHELLERTQTLVQTGASFDAARLARTFTMASTDFFDTVVLPRALPALLREAPSTSVATRFVADAIEPLLLSRELDVGFGTRFRRQPALVVEDVGDDELVLLARTGHPALRRGLDLDTFVGLDHVLVAPRGLPGSPIDTLLEARGRARRVAVRTSSFGAAAHLVATTDLVTSLPSRFAKALARRDPVKAVPLPFTAPRYTFSLAWARVAEDDPAHAWFRQHILAAARAALR
jgi:DNA-binding transcriptional LysR family regulator